MFWSMHESSEAQPKCFISVSLLFLPQGLEEGSTSHLRTASGTSPASPAPSALLHWWAPASSPMETRSCAANATATATYKQSFTPPFPWHTCHPSSQHFKNPELLPRTVTQANKCCLSGCFYIEISSSCSLSGSDFCNVWINPLKVPSLTKELMILLNKVDWVPLK